METMQLFCSCNDNFTDARAGGLNYPEGEYDSFYCPSCFMHPWYYPVK